MPQLSPNALLNPGPAPQKSAPAQLNPGSGGGGGGGRVAYRPQISAPARLNPGPAPQRSATALLNPAHITPSHITVPPGGTDAQSSGPGYGSAQVNLYKQSAGYKLAIVQTFLHQPDPMKSAILKGAVNRPSFEGNLVLNFLHQRVPSDLFGPLLSKYGVDIGAKGLKDTGLGTESGIGNVGKLANSGLAGFESLLPKPGIGPGGQFSSEGFSGGPLTQVLARAPIDIARAAIQDPGVIPKTITGLGSTAAAGAAGLVQLPIRMVQEGPGKAISQLASGVAHDYSQRYGPLAAGNDNAFIARIKQQGAGPEALDALGAVGGLDATVGRAATGLAKTREALTGESNFLTRPRPALRISGNETRAQTLARGAGKITAQRIEDRVRAARGSTLPLRAGEVAPVLASRGMKILVSNVAAKTRRLMQEDLNRVVRQGAEPAFRKLGSWEKKAAPVALEGFIPLRSGPDKAVAAIDARIQHIQADRLNNRLSPGNRIPAQYAAQIDELPRLNELKANVDKWLTSKLANFVDHEGARSASLEAKDLRMESETAAARRLRPQGEMLGIKHPDVVQAEAEQRLAGAQNAAAKADAAAAKATGKAGAAPVTATGRVGFRNALTFERDARGAVGHATDHQQALRAAQDAAAAYEKIQETRPGDLRDYAARVRAAAAERGWPKEPAYIKHTMVPKMADHSAYTQGMGARAIPAAKQSHFALWHGGAVDRNPQVYMDSLAKSIKGAHHWKLVDEQARRNALPAPTAEAIRGALGHDKAPADLTGYEHAAALAHMGVDLNHYRFYNPGRMARSSLQDLGFDAAHGSRAGSAPLEMETNAELHSLMSQQEHSQEGGAVAKALRENSSVVNDSFMKTKGWKALPNHAYDEIHSSLKPSGKAGRLIGRAQGLTAGAILGGSPSFVIMNTMAHALLATFGTRGRILTDAAKFPLWWHGLSPELKDVVRANSGGRGHFRLENMGSQGGSLVQGFAKLKQSGLGRVAHAVSPMHLLFRAEDMQSNFFRHMVYYDATKKMALDNMSKEASLGARAMLGMEHVFTVGPKQQMAETLRSVPMAEELGRHTVNMMGDYARFTYRERTGLNNRGVLFYSFLRHAARTLFYVLPFKHPIATALVGEMAKLHKDEVQKMLGGVNLPWAYSRVYFDSNGKLTSIDFARSSPVGNAVTDIPGQGIAGAAGFIAPEIQPILDMLYGQNVTGTKVPKNVFTLLGDYASLSYPYRLAKDLHFGTHLQNADSIPYLHENPLTHKTAAAQQYQQAKEQANGPIGQKILAGATGLYPKPDDIRVIAQHRAAAAAAKQSKVGALPGLPGLPGLPRLP